MECLLFQPHPHKKNSCRMLEGEKKTCKHIPPKKNFIVNHGVQNKFMTRPNHPPPPPRFPQKSNGRPPNLKVVFSFSSNAVRVVKYATFLFDMAFKSANTHQNEGKYITVTATCKAPATRSNSVIQHLLVQQC